MKYLFALSFFSAFFLQNAFSQSGAPKFVNPSPVSPNAASLGKYVEVPVGLYTGIPSISVPFYDINSGGINIPVNLSYYAGGVKVEETPSWVGLGWSLNAGGVISRQVRGLPDEGPGGYMTNSQLTDNYLNGTMSASVKENYLTDVLNGVIDSQQDIYFYNFGSESGKFLLDPSGKAICIPINKTLIEFGTFLGEEKSWKITSENGNIHYFTAKEVTGSTTSGDISYSESPTSWYLTRVLNSSETEQVDFEYETSSYTFRTIVSQTKFIFDSGYPEGNRNESSSYSQNIIWGQRLSKIKFKNGQISFIKNTQQRSDLPSDYSLQSIILKSDNSGFYKKINLHQSYFVSAEESSISPSDRHRLILDSVSMTDVNGIKEGSYKFTYNTDANLPSRNSFSQDYWGFYNGAENGFRFVPTTLVYHTTSDPTIPSLIEGADRKPNVTFAKAGILTSVTYPTKGRTVFEYEGNRASNVPAVMDVVTGYQTSRILSDGSSTSYEKFFSVSKGFGGMQGVFAKIQVYREGCPPETTAGCPVTILHFPSGQMINVNSNNNNLYLPIGEYRIEANLTGVNDPNMLSNYFVRIDVPVGEYQQNPYNITVGGLRVKKVISYDHTGLNVGTKYYTYLRSDSVNRSSGFLVSFPSYVSDLTDYKTIIAGPHSYDVQTKYITISSGSNLPLAMTQSSTVGYSSVQETQNEQGLMGKTEYDYKIAGDIYMNEFPFPPSTSREWKRGLLASRRDFRYDISTNKYEIVQKKTIDYIPMQEQFYRGVKIGRRNFGNISGLELDKRFEVAEFLTSTGWLPIEADSNTVIDPTNGTVISDKSTYSYNSNNLMQIKATSLNSEGVLRERFKAYPHDMVSSGRDQNGVYQGMIARNIINTLIEQSEIVNGKTSLQITNYKQVKPKLYLPGTTDVLNTKSGLNEVRLRYHEYDDSGNMTSVSQEGGTRTNYIWSYKRQYPIAEIKNVDYSTLVAALGGVTEVNNFADKAFPTKTEIEAFLLPTRSNTDVFKAAMVTTYTYEPLQGVTSITDPKGQTTYFIYDSFNRLNFVKDHNGNIVKNQEYHYKP